MPSRPSSHRRQTPMRQLRVPAPLRQMAMEVAVGPALGHPVRVVLAGREVRADLEVVGLDSAGVAVAQVLGAGLDLAGDLGLVVRPQRGRWAVRMRLEPSGSRGIRSFSNFRTIRWPIC